uniref:Uncharacterized protein n=1 Tax=Lotharella oceanica TaxID=641309 RepID=A0A7S2X6D9_9EUKA
MRASDVCMRRRPASRPRRSDNGVSDDTNDEELRGRPDGDGDEKTSTMAGARTFSQGPAEVISIYSNLPEHAIVNLVRVFSMLVQAPKHIKKQRIKELLKALNIPTLGKLGLEIRQSVCIGTSTGRNFQVIERLGSFLSAISYALSRREAIHRVTPRWIRVPWRMYGNVPR